MIDIGTHNHQHINCLTTLDFDIPIHHRIHIETKGSGDAPPVYLKGCSTPTSHLANCLCKAIIYYREVFIVAPYCIWWKTYKPQRYIGGDPLKMTKCAVNFSAFRKLIAMDIPWPLPTRGTFLYQPFIRSYATCTRIFEKLESPTYRKVSSSQ